MPKGERLGHYYEQTGEPVTLRAEVEIPGHDAGETFTLVANPLIRFLLKKGMVTLLDGPDPMGREDLDNPGTYVLPT